MLVHGVAQQARARLVRDAMHCIDGGLTGCVGAQAKGALGVANDEDDSDAFGGIERDSPLDLLGGRGEVRTM